MPGIHIIVSGRVQGVGFRYYTQDEAIRLNLFGWVRNLPSGDVEISASGAEGDLKTFLKRVQQGPPLSRVIGLKTEWTEEESNEPFHVR